MRTPQLLGAVAFRGNDLNGIGLGGIGRGCGVQFRDRQRGIDVGGGGARLAARDLEH